MGKQIGDAIAIFFMICIVIAIVTGIIAGYLVSKYIL